MLQLTYRAAFLSLAVLLAITGCTPTPQTPAERRKDDIAFWTNVGEKFTNVEADLMSSESSYDQHEMDWISGDINTSLGEASNAHYAAGESPWDDVGQSLATAADAMTDTLNDFQTSVQNTDPAAMEKAYNDYLSYKRNALAATKQARADYVRDGGKASDIRDFFGTASGDDASVLLFYANVLKKKAKTQK